MTTIQGLSSPRHNKWQNARALRLSFRGATLSGFTLTGGATTGERPTAAGFIALPRIVIVTNCVIAGNAAPYAAGVFSGTLNNCIIKGNRHLHRWRGTTKRIRGSVLSNNAAPGTGWGGGANNCLLLNCVLARNQAGYRGGAAENSTLINCTVVAITGQPDSLDGCNLQKLHCLLQLSRQWRRFRRRNVFHQLLRGLRCHFQQREQFHQPAGVRESGRRRFHLSAASPCINAGNNSFITNGTDLDGNPRIVGGIVDLGAYEFQSPVRYVNVGNTDARVAVHQLDHRRHEHSGCH